MALHRGNPLTLGTDANGKPVTLSREQRATHLYCVGSTGTGKSKFLEHLIRQDILNWRESTSGLLLIDPHGSSPRNHAPVHPGLWESACQCR